MKVLKDYEKIVIEAKIPKTTKNERVLYGKQSEINFVYTANDKGLSVIFNNEINVYDIDCLETQSNTYIDVKRRSTYELNGQECLYVEKRSVYKYLEVINNIPLRYNYKCVLAFDISKDSNNIDFVFIELKELLNLIDSHEAYEINDCIYFPILQTKSFSTFLNYVKNRKINLSYINQNKLETKLLEILSKDKIDITNLSYYSSIIQTKNVAFWLNKVRRVKDNTFFDERLTAENCMIFSKYEFDSLLEIYNNGGKKTDLWICFDIKHETLKNELRFLTFEELLYNYRKPIKPSVWVQNNNIWMNTLKTDCITEAEFDEKYLKKYF